MEQPKYKPFSNTPEKYNTPGSYGPQTPQGPPSYSPLGLADIRTRTEAQFADPMFSPTTAIEQNNVMQYPIHSGYSAPWPIYALDWCKWPPRSGTGSAGKVAIGSYSEDGPNWLQVLDAQVSQTDAEEPTQEFTKTAEATHAYPVTRILWEPPSSNKQTTDLLATSGDHLRLWSLPSDPTQSYQSNSILRKDQPLQKLSPLALLSNSKSPEHTAPITSLDWNVVQPSLIITSSIDTTCTIWDIPTLTAKTQLIAHDKEVYDVRFCANSVDVFVSCGADGSVRMFDLRSLEHSTIIYEPSEKTDKSGSSPSPLSPRTSH
jgi:DDB1- and CUL4-associated factor 7